MQGQVVLGYLRGAAVRFSCLLAQQGAKCVAVSIGLSAVGLVLVPVSGRPRINAL